MEYFIKEDERIARSSMKYADKERAQKILRAQYEAASKRMEAIAARFPRGGQARKLLQSIQGKMFRIIYSFDEKSKYVRAEQRDWSPTTAPHNSGETGFVAVQRRWAQNDGGTKEDAEMQTAMPVAGRGSSLKSAKTTSAVSKPKTVTKQVLQNQQQLKQSHNLNASQQIGIPVRKNSNPLNPVQEIDKFGNQIYYRTMSAADYQRLQATGKLPPSTAKETSISPLYSYSSKYKGLTVKLVVKPGTSESLQKIGISANPRTVEILPNLPFKGGQGGKWESINVPFKGKGWTETNVRFKVESGQTTTQLGTGEGLKLFNQNLVHFELIK